MDTTDYQIIHAIYGKAYDTRSLHYVKDFSLIVDLCTYKWVCIRDVPGSDVNWWWIPRLIINPGWYYKPIQISPSGLIIIKNGTTLMRYTGSNTHELIEVSAGSIPNY